MKIITGKENDYKKWFDKNSDPYGRRCFTYAEDLAEMLEKLIDDSKESPEKVIMENARSTSDKADTDEITGFMYGMSISILCQFWVYGEFLKKWNDSGRK